MLVENGVKNEELTLLRDAGAEFYGQDEAFQSGASGAGCSAAVFLVMLFNKCVQGAISEYY